MGKELPANVPRATADNAVRFCVGFRRARTDEGKAAAQRRRGLCRRIRVPNGSRDACPAPARPRSGIKIAELSQGNEVLGSFSRQLPDDDMIEQLDLEQLGCFGHTSRQAMIRLAG